VAAYVAAFDSQEVLIVQHATVDLPLAVKAVMFKSKFELEFFSIISFAAGARLRFRFGVHGKIR
jgi:hypothetical protein